jgi:N-acetylglucosamine-6-sulfatase
VFLTSDNGFLWEEHGLERKGPPYVQGLRIPMVVRWPRHVAAGASDHRFAATIDIAPTVMAATGTPVPAKRPMDGRSLLEGWQRSPFLAEFWKVHTARPPSWASLRTRTHQYVEYYGPAGAIIFREYYALGPDPWELVNLLHDGVSGNEPNVRRLHRKLHAMRRCEGDRCW